MRKVIIPKEFRRSMQLVTETTEGHWDDNGNWVEGVTITKDVYGALFPFNPTDFKNYPEGLLKNDDRKLVIDEDLKDNDVIMLGGEKFIIVTLQDYGYLSNAGFYVFRRSINDTGTN